MKDEFTGCSANFCRDNKYSGVLNIASLGTVN